MTWEALTAILSAAVSFTVLAGIVWKASREFTEVKADIRQFMSVCHTKHEGLSQITAAQHADIQRQITTVAKDVEHIDADLKTHLNNHITFAVGGPD